MYKLEIQGNLIQVLPREPRTFSDREISLFKSLGGKQKGFSVVFPNVMSYLHILFRKIGKENFRSETPELPRRWSLPSGFPLVSDPPGFEGAFPYQRESGRFLLDSPIRGSLLSLSPGMGKTFTSIKTWDALGSQRILVVATLILLTNWEGEIRRWSLRDLPITIFRGIEPFPEEGIVLTNYEQMGKIRSGKPVLKPALDRDWDLIVFDESIRLKSKDADRSRLAVELGSRSKKVWLLSGVPISKDNSDLWSQFRVIDPHLFKSFWRFAREYCIVEPTPWGDQIVGSNPSIDVAKEFRDLIFVRDKRQELDLPPLLYDSFIIEMTPLQKSMYERALNEFILELSTGEVSIKTKLTQIQRLQQILSSTANIDLTTRDSGKIDFLAEELEIGEIETPCLVFGFWKGGLRHLQEELEKRRLKSRLLDGDVDPVDRDPVIRDYQQGSLPILLLSYGVGQYGINLQNTRSLVFLDKVYGSEQHIQARDRVDRIGRTEPCRIINLNCPGTIEERIMDSLTGKFTDISRLTGTDLVHLLKGIGK